MDDPCLCGRQTEAYNIGYIRRKIVFDKLSSRKLPTKICLLLLIRKIVFKPLKRETSDTKIKKILGEVQYVLMLCGIEGCYFVPLRCIYYFIIHFVNQLCFN